MQNHLSESTEEILPSAKIEMPSFQKENAHSSSVNKNTKLFKSTVRGLGFTTIVLSVILFCMSIAEVSIKACRKERVYDYSYEYYYDHYNLTTRCYSNFSLGVGIWCSILPFIAGIFGVLAGSKSSSQCKNGLLIGFSIVGSVMSFVLILLQSDITVNHRWRTAETPAIFRLQIAILCTTGINFILLIISSALSCCLCKCCCRQSKRPIEHRIVYTYVPGNPNQQVTNQPPIFHNQQVIRNV